MHNNTNKNLLSLDPALSHETWSTQEKQHLRPIEKKHHTCSHENNNNNNNKSSILNYP